MNDVVKSDRDQRNYSRWPVFGKDIVLVISVMKFFEYFQKPGPSNTVQSLEITASPADDNFITFIAASTTGSTGVWAAEILKGRNVNLVAVGHGVGFREPGHDGFCPEHAASIKGLGVTPKNVHHDRNTTPYINPMI